MLEQLHIHYFNHKVLKGGAKLLNGMQWLLALSPGLSLLEGKIRAGLHPSEQQYKLWWCDSVSQFNPFCDLSHVIGFTGTL